MSKNNDDPQQKCYKICSDFLQGPWKIISVEDMKFSEFKGGLMNKLFYCALPDSTAEKYNTKENIPKEVLVRFYGPVQEDNESLMREVIIFAFLSEINIGPKLYGVFHNGRIEQYLPSKSASTWNDFSDIYVDVAKELAKIHSLVLPIKKTPAALKGDVLKWLEDFKKASINSPERFSDIISSGEFEEEHNWLITEIEKLGVKIVFSHNDLQGGNILLLNNPPKDVKKRITFVDYEYSAYNYRSYDIANFFVVKCLNFNPSEDPSLFETDINQFPTKDEQEKFVDVYLNELQELNNEFESDFQKEKEKKKILKEISLLRLGPCLFLTIVTLKVGLNPHGEFPYWECGCKLWALYKKFKVEILHDRKLNGI